LAVKIEEELTKLSISKDKIELAKESIPEIFALVLNDKMVNMVNG